MGAQFRRLGQNGDGFSLDLEADLRGFGQLPQSRRQAAFGRVVHGGDAAGLCRGQCLRDDADPGMVQVVPGARQGRRVDLSQPRGELPGQETASLDRDAFGEKEHISRASAARGDQSIAGHLAEHRPRQDRAIESGRDLSVPADQLGADLPAGLLDLGEDRLNHCGPAVLLGEQRATQEPARLRARRGDVVGVDVDGVPADAVGGEGDRIGLDHQESVAEVEHRAIEADPGAEQDARVAGLQPGQ